MLRKMLNILGMDQILLLNIISRMILLPMMDLILVLIVAMVSGAHAKIRQAQAVVVPRRDELVFCNGARFVGVEHGQHRLDDALFAEVGDVRRGGVEEAVGALDVVGHPEARGVVVVEREKGLWVEGRYVVLLYLFC